MRAVFDIGGSRIRAGRSAAPGVVEAEGVWTTPGADYGAFVEVLREGMGPDATSMALSIAGVVDPATGRIRAANIPCLDGRQLGADLARDLGVPVVLANDADCFALAEARSGAGIGHRVVFGVILGTGVGGGLVIDGRIHQGAGGVAGEWGHGPVLRGLAPEIADWQCGCGQAGCLDTFGGARGIERLDRYLNGGARTSVEVLAAWGAGEDSAGRVISFWLDQMSAALAMVVNVIGPSVVPVGGGLANAAALVAALDGAVRGRILRDCPQPLMVVAQNQGEPGMIGASWLEVDNG